MKRSPVFVCTDHYMGDDVTRPSVFLFEDRDSGHWIRDDQREIERRRKLFWEIYAYGAPMFPPRNEITISPHFRRMDCRCQISRHDFLTQGVGTDFYHGTPPILCIAPHSM